MLHLYCKKLMCQQMGGGSLEERWPLWQSWLGSTATGSILDTQHVKLQGWVDG